MHLEMRLTFVCSVCRATHDSEQALPPTCRPYDPISKVESHVAVLALGYCPVCYMPIEEKDVLHVARRAAKLYMRRERARQRKGAT
jgi:hypothetical protein